MRPEFENLGFNRELISRDCEVCLKLAHCYENFNNSNEIESVTRDHIIVAATYFRRAAAHSLILDEVPNAFSYFEKAASLYVDANMAYGLLLASFSPQVLSELILVFLTNNRNHIDHRNTMYVALAQSVNRDFPTDRESHILESLQPYRSFPMGILSIPLGAHLDLAAASQGDYSTIAASQGDYSTMIEVLSPIFNAYNIAVQTAKRDIFHWQRMAFPFHPAEPDIFSLVQLATARDSKRRSYMREITDSFHIADDTRTLLSGIIDSMYGST